MHTPLLDLNTEITWHFSTIYWVGVNGFNDFLDYLYQAVYIHAINTKVIDWSLALFMFMLWLTFICAFIFFRPNK